MSNRFIVRYIVVDTKHPSIGFPVTLSHHDTEVEAMAEAESQQQQQDQAELDLSRQHRG